VFAKVSAINAKGSSLLSPASLGVQLARVPDPPTSLVASTNGVTVDLSWVIPVLNGG
jgi:hypothetical protein